MKNKFIIAIILALSIAGVILLIFWFKPSTETSSNKISVVTSFYPLYFFTSQIGGEKVDVLNITPAGAEPHDYEPTAQDIARIERSQLLVMNGGGLEAWGESIEQNTDPNRTIILTVGEGLINKQVTESGESIIDPHIWLSPPLVQKIADKIAAGLIKADPSNASYYQANANTLKIKLSELDNEFKNGLSHCAQNSIITSHAAFGYLASAYNLKQVSVTGLSPDAEPSPQQLGRVADFARKNNVKYIFFESLVSPKLSETIAREIGAQTLILNPLEGLSDQDLAQGKDYFTEMKTNLANLQIALQCQK